MVKVRSDGPLGSRNRFSSENVNKVLYKSTVQSQKDFVCEDCGFGFTRSSNLIKHRHKKHTPGDCPKCGDHYESQFLHKCKNNGPEVFPCSACGYSTIVKANYMRHWRLNHSASARLLLTRKKEAEAYRRKQQYKSQIERVSAKEDQKLKSRLLREARSLNKQHIADLRKTKNLRIRALHKCWICSEMLHSKDDLADHLDIEHNPMTSALEPGQDPEKMYGLRRSAFKGVIAEYVREYGEGELIDIHHLFREDNASDIIAYNLCKMKSMKLGCVVKIMMQVADESGVTVNLEEFDFVGTYQTMYLESDIMRAAEDALSDFREQFALRLDQFEEGKGSGWRLAYISSCVLRINKLPHMYEGRHGTSAMRTFIDKYISKTFFRPQNLENVPSKEGECFYYAVAQYFVGKKYICKGKRKQSTQVELDAFVKQKIKKNIGVPAKLNRICRFEDLNKHLDIKVNVFLHESGEGPNGGNHLVPLRPSKCKKSKSHTINLLLMYIEGISHYVLIRDLSKAVSKKYARSNGNFAFSKHEPCPRCFTVLSNGRALERHLKRCDSNQPQVLKPEPPGSKIKFKSEMKQYPIPIFAVADFEARMDTPTDRDIRPTEKRCAVEKQIPVSYCLAVFDWKGNVLFKKTESSQHECMKLFFKALQDAQIVIFSELKKNVPHGVPPSEMIRMKKDATECVLCKKPFNSYKRDKILIKKMRTEGELEGEELRDYNMARVLDHCHHSGETIGIVHNRCNLLRSGRSREIPVFLHNFSGYDSHFITSGLSELSAQGQDLSKMKLQGLSYNMNKLRTLNMWIYKFIDSMAFLDSSLDSLVKDLVIGNHDFSLVRKCGIAKNDAQLDLICRKGIFPYSALRSLQEFEDATEIPPKELFFSNLSHSHITDEEYEHAKVVFKEFGCRNMKDYLHLYNEIDVVLLAESLLCFRNEIQEHFGLDLFQYISVPQLSMDCFLKSTGAEIENIQDVELFLETEKNIRGGVSFVRERWARATDDEKILYIDANNLYGMALSLPVPVSDYERLSSDDIKKIKWRDLSFRDKYGYLASVTLEAPPSVHERLEEFPPAPHSVEITYSMLSPYAKRALAACTEKPETYRARKLIGSFLPKKSYLCHGMNLKLYLELGYKIKKIHSVTRFRQKRIFKSYIKKTMDLRRQSKSKFKSNLWKRMNNATYGKTIQNGRKYLQTSFFVKQKNALKYGASPRFKGFDVLDDDLVLGFSTLPHIKMDKPYLIGFTILELSKCFMYSAYHHIIKKQCPKARLLMSDTDSFLISLPGKTPEDAISRIKNICDFSNTDPSNSLHDLSRKSIVGFFKEELGMKRIIEECSLIRSKCYSLKTIDRESFHQSNVNRCKGVKKKRVDSLPYEAYKSVLLSFGAQDGSQTVLRSHKHAMYTLNMRKRFFSSFDDKTYLKSCGIHSLPYGDFRIKRDGPGCQICGVYEEDCDNLMK